MFDLTHASSDLHDDTRVRPSAFPDSIHAEMLEAFPDRHGDYTPAEETEMYEQYLAGERARQLNAFFGTNGDDRTPPPAAPAIFPELDRYTDNELAFAISFVDSGEHPELTASLCGDRDPERFIDEASAELLRRLDAINARLAA